LTIAVSFGGQFADCAAFDPFLLGRIYHLFSDAGRMAAETRLVTAMFIASITRHIRGAANRFGGAEDGNIAVIFAITCLPILTFVGAAIDYSRANNARSSMQAALDSTALMVSKDLSQGLITTSQINTKAQAYFAALYTNKDAQSVAISATYTAASGSSSSIIQVNGSGSITTDFMKVAGFPNMNFNTMSTATWGSSKLRVALVLDNTYSMSDSGKMPALQSAAKTLVDTLSAQAANNGDVLISIVPFNVDVNVGTSNINATWLDWSDWDANHGSCSSGSYTTQSTCTSHGNTWNTNRGNWTGCVQDRTTTNNYDTLSTAPNTAIAATLFQPVKEDFFFGFFGDPCPQQIMPLSYDWTALKAKITAMHPNGTTNQQIGVMWGWLSLLQQLPLSAPAEDPNYNYKKVIILLSDGDNTANRTYPWDGTGGYPSQTTINAIDARQKILCDNIKAGPGGISIYTIQVNTDGTANSSVMQYCASGNANFFSTTSSSGISTAFASIGTSLSKLRVAR
jgi:Flp pilus assembly protein TadG